MFPKGSGRTKLPSHKRLTYQITINFSEPMFQTLSELSDKFGMDRQSVIRHCLRHYLVPSFLKFHNMDEQQRQLWPIFERGS